MHAPTDDEHRAPDSAPVPDPGRPSEAREHGFLRAASDAAAVFPQKGEMARAGASFGLDAGRPSEGGTDATAEGRGAARSASPHRAFSALNPTFLREVANTLAQDGYPTTSAKLRTASRELQDLLEAHRLTHEAANALAEELDRERARRALSIAVQEEAVRELGRERESHAGTLRELQATRNNLREVRDVLTTVLRAPTDTNLP